MGRLGLLALATTLLLISISAFGTERPSASCEDLLAKKTSTDDIVAQEAVQTREAQVRDAIAGYAEELGPYQDPFALAFSAEKGEQIFERLLTLGRKKHTPKTPLALINAKLKKEYAGSQRYNDKLVAWLISDTKKLLSDPKHSRLGLQSNLLALRYTLEYLRRYKAPEKVVDRDGKPEKKKEEKKEEKKKDKKEKGEEKDTPPEYPELPDAYKPFTKDTEKEKGGKQKQHRVAEANFETPFFAQKYYAEINRSSPEPFQRGELPEQPAPVRRFEATAKELVVRTFGKKQVPLFLPPLHRPLQPSDPRATISRTSSGGYVLELKEDIAEIHIPLTEDKGIVMMPHVRAMYERPVGFKTEEWPEETQIDIIRKFSAEDAKRDPLKIAQAIADHLASPPQYLYSVGARPETDPIDALKAGAFQCDIAAFSMIGLTRDVYKIPSRIVAGFRGKKYKSGGDNKSYLVIPGQAHAWVEVFHDGQWHLFDPTPIKKDKKEKNDEDGEKDEYSDNRLENTPKDKDPQEGEKSDSKSKEDKDDAKSSESGDEAQDHQKRLDEDTQKRVDEVKKGDIEQQEKKDEKASDDEPSKEDLAEQLELGSLELEPQLDRNTLLERAMRVLLRVSIDPTKTGSVIANNLSRLTSLMKRFSSPQLKKLVVDANIAHEKDHPDLKNWIDHLVRIMSDQDVNTTYQELHRIRKTLDVYTRLLDREDAVPHPHKLASLLERAQEKLRTLAHPDSSDIAIVNHFVKNLPSIPRILLKEWFDLTSVGPNAATRNVAEALRSGKLNDLRLLAILSPLSDFILNSTPRPETIDVKTWQRDTARPRGRDILGLTRFSDLTRAIMGQPGKSIEENIRAGTAYVPVRRKRVDIPAGHGKEESERITIVLYDTSGSMSGEPGRFQAGLISAFTSKALSDVAPSGKHRHRVVIVPFSDTPGTPVPVTNTAEALDVVRNYQEKLKNTGGGTQIQAALIQAYALIADAERRTGEPLAAANVVVMTDGQSEINAEELLQARKAIDRQTPLQTMFIAINSTNEELMRFAMDSQTMGAERGFYREFTPTHISDILKEADHLKETGEGAFHSEKKGSEIPQEVYALLEQALREAAIFVDHVHDSNRHLSAAEHLKELEKLKWHDKKDVDRPLERWLLKVRNFARHPVFSDRRLLERIVDDLVRNFEPLTGVSLGDLGDREQEHLRHFVRHAAGLEDPS